MIYYYSIISIFAFFLLNFLLLRFYPCLYRHDWSEWKYSNDNSKGNICKKLRKCNRKNCKKEEIQYDAHEYSKATYVNKNDCKMVEKCIKCGYMITKENHDFSSWEYINTLDCEQIRTCKRCHKKEYCTQHQWKNWKYIDSQYHDRYCIRNKDHYEKQIHDWQTRTEYKTDKQFILSDGNIVMDEDGHVYGNCVPPDCYETIELIVCVKCGVEK